MITFSTNRRHYVAIVEKVINIDQKSRSQTQTAMESLFGQFPNCRRNPSAVVVSCELCSHRRRDATRQFRRVGGVYWALDNDFWKQFYGKRKALPQPHGSWDGADFHLFSCHQLTLPDHGYGASAITRLFYIHYIYSRGGVGQAELIWVASYIHTADTQSPIPVLTWLDVDQLQA